jgi:nucleoside-diphosphate-sugar epimerase
MARVFVTGGSGFVGRNLIAMLREAGNEIMALARSEEAANAVREAGAAPVHGDLDDARALHEGMRGASLAVHCAAKVDDWGPLEEFFRVNVEGTQHVLDAAKAAGVARLVYVSTEAVLVGAGPIVRADETRPLPVNAFGGYPISKGLAEECVLAANSPSFATVIVRPRFIWGRGDSVLLPRLADATKKGQLVWFSGGRYLTSTCHVRNVCEGILCAAAAGRPGEIYFLTDGEPVEFRAFVTDLLRTQGIEPTERSLPFGVAYAAAGALEAAWRWLPLRGHPPITRAALRLIGEEVTVVDAKARREIGYVSHVSRAQGLRELSEANAVARSG